jgi:hypothetical protein
VLKESKLKGSSGNIHTGGGNRSGHLGLGITRQQGKSGFNFRMGGYYWRNVGEGLTTRSNNIDSHTYYLLQKQSCLFQS